MTNHVRNNKQLRTGAVHYSELFSACPNHTITAKLIALSWTPDSRQSVRKPFSVRVYSLQTHFVSFMWYDEGQKPESDVIETGESRLHTSPIFLKGNLGTAKVCRSFDLPRKNPEVLPCTPVLGIISSECSFAYVNSVLCVCVSPLCWVFAVRYLNYSRAAVKLPERLSRAKNPRTGNENASMRCFVVRIIYVHPLRGTVLAELII